MRVELRNDEDEMASAFLLLSLTLAAAGHNAGWANSRVRASGGSSLACMMTYTYYRATAPLYRPLEVPRTSTWQPRVCTY